MKITYEGGALFSAKTRGHTITVDLPKEKGGADKAMTPPELFVASLGVCVGMHVTQYLARIGVDLKGATVDLKWELSEKPARVGRINILVDVPAGIPKERRAAVYKVAQSCLIHQTIARKPEINIELV